MRPFEEPEGAPTIETTRLEPVHHNWYVHLDLAEDVSTLEVINDAGRIRLEDSGLEVQTRTVERYSSWDDDFASIRGDRSLKRGDWEISIVIYTVLTSDAENLKVHATVAAYEGCERIFSNTWSYHIPRRMV